MIDLNRFPNNLKLKYYLLVLKLPNTTPSGFNIGIILMIWFDKNSEFYSLYSVNFIRIPFNTNEAHVYPG